MIGEELNRELNGLHASIGQLSSITRLLTQRIEQLENGNGTIQKVESRLSREINKLCKRLDELNG